MPNVFYSIGSALDSHLAAMVGLPEVAWPNKRFPPTKGTTYLRPSVLPGSTAGATIGSAGTDEHVGVYQISIFSPEGKGRKEAEVLADLIADHFKPVTELTSGGYMVRAVRVSRGAASTEEGWYHIPIEIRYLSLAVKR